MSDRPAKQRLQPPYELHPSLRFSRYLVWLDPLLYVDADSLTRREAESVAEQTGWIIMTRAELLKEWRKRL